MENIKRILDSSAGVLIELDKINKNNEKKVIDNRFELVKREVNSINNKDDKYYENLIKLLSKYIDELYDKKTTGNNKDVYGNDGKVFFLVNSFFDTLDKIRIGEANRNLSINLFDYVCYILKNNINIKLDSDTLKKLFNKDPKRFELVAELSYIYRNLNFNKLANILKKNNTIDKSNITTDELYDILIKTCQITDKIIFVLLVTKEKYNENHKKIDDLLKCCNSKTFVDITNIIINNYDKNFDRLSVIKERNNGDFTAAVICKLLDNSKENHIDLIHKILNDDSIKLDYNYSYADYIGMCSLKADIAKSGNKIIIKDLLSKKENVEECYWDGEYPIYLYSLYAIIGEYEKSLELFEKKYRVLQDFTSDFDVLGCASADITYDDSLNSYVEKISCSLNDDNIDYEKKKEIIYRILNNKEVKYINLYDFGNSIKEVLNKKDFNDFLDLLLKKHEDYEIEFINVSENFNGFYTNYYNVKTYADSDIKEIINTLKK